MIRLPSFALPGITGTVLLLAFATPAIAEGIAASDAPPDDDSGPKTDRSKRKAPPDKDGGKDEEKKPAQCVSHTTQARFVSGYDHLVHLSNSCDESAACEVSTDVNPEVQTVTVPAQGKKTVLTFRGSPARVFQATVVCKMNK